MSAPAARRLNTQYLSAERVAEIVRRKGLANCIAGVASFVSVGAAMYALVRREVGAVAAVVAGAVG